MKNPFFTSKEIKPKGWLYDQLKLEATGLCGNLDKIWPDVRDSAWIGGDREGWERVPYWLDGFIPLAYLLEDEDMIARAKFYIDRILSFQMDDGWICPLPGNATRSTYDHWAILLISKVLVVYHDCSGDERIPSVLYRIMKNLHDLMKDGTVKLFGWGKARWYEGFVALNRLHEWHPDETWIVELAHDLRDQGTDYTSLKDRWIRPINRWTFETHVVNLAMMFKYEAISHSLLGEEYTDVAEELWQHIMKYNSMACGMFTGDECLSGDSPIQGVEFCAVVELMYALEWLYAATGNAKWAERLERISFNALPATASEDMWTHQYVQMTNQINCMPFPGRSLFRTNNSEAHLFGLEPNYGCCTANFGQGWPKLALSVFQKTIKGITTVIPLPVELNLKHGNADIKVELITSYPFRSSFTYRVTASEDCDFSLEIRIPPFAKNLRVNGAEVISTNWFLMSGFSCGVTDVCVEWDTVPVLEDRPRGLKVARFGSLLFSLPIDATWKKVEYERGGVVRQFPYCDYHIQGGNDWNYAFASDALTVIEGELTTVPFSAANPPLRLTASLAHIDWGYEDGFETVCAKVPEHTAATDAPRTIELIPYGAAKLRMTEMPMVE